MDATSPTGAQPAHTPEIGRFGAVTVAIIAAVGVVFGSAITAYASRLTFEQSIIEGCIRRVDTQESQLREKAQVVLSSVGQMIATTGKREMTVSDFETSAAQVIKATYELVAYAPPAFGFQTLKLTAVTHQALTARTVEQAEAAIAAATTSMNGWPSTYYELMKSFEAQRQACRKI